MLVLKFNDFSVLRLCTGHAQSADDGGCYGKSTAYQQAACRTLALCNEAKEQCHGRCSERLPQ